MAGRRGKKSDQKTAVSYLVRVAASRHVAPLFIFVGCIFLRR